MMMNGSKLIPQASKVSLKTTHELAESILAPLAFFSLYGVPLTGKKIFQLLYQTKSSQQEVNKTLDILVGQGRLYKIDELYSLKPWNPIKWQINQQEVDKRWMKVKRYHRLMSLLPFVEHMSIIHSLAIGNVDQESDIDLLVITKPGRLYFVRSLIIVLFRLLGIYKTRSKISEQFCFGYYLTAENMDISQIEGQDSFLAFWFASHIPILGQGSHAQFVQANRWVQDYFPNYQPNSNPDYLHSPAWANVFKKVFEILLWLPASLVEPLLRWIHIRHTFRLPENSWATSTTIATNNTLKLHAVSQRREINEAFVRVLQSLD